jgi:hypothetical protein
LKDVFKERQDRSEVDDLTEVENPMGITKIEIDGAASETEFFERNLAGIRQQPITHL